jgi:beta-phosphoglucomutase
MKDNLIPNLKAILFDFDGTLADTMEDNFLAWKKAFQKYNIEITREDYFPLEGLLLIEIAKRISRKYNLVVDDFNNVVELKNSFYLANNNFRFYQGVEELIKTLKKKYILALVSASPRQKLEKTVPNDFLKLFNVIISGDDVKNGKPNPEPYLSAIKHLFLNPEDCIAVENAPLGIESAKSAGVYCIAVTSTVSKEYLKKADKIISNILELPSFLI